MIQAGVFYCFCTYVFKRVRFVIWAGLLMVPTVQDKLRKYTTALLGTRTFYFFQWCLPRRRHYQGNTQFTWAIHWSFQIMVHTEGEQHTREYAQLRQFTETQYWGTQNNHNYRHFV